MGLMTFSVSQLLIAATLAVGYAERPPFISLKAPAETIREYEVYTPVVLNEIREEEWLSELSGSVPEAKGQLQNFDVEVSDYLIHLELNRNLVSPEFTSHHYDQDGTTVVEKGHVNCFYHGTVKGHPKWHVAMSTCHGLQGSFGELGSADNYYHLEPLDRDNTTMLQPHALYAASEYAEEERTCGVGVPHHQQSQTKEHITPAIPHVETNRVRRLVNGFNIVEWAMINDFTQYNNYGSDIGATVMRGLEIANYVDSLFRVLSVRVVVVRMITWTSGDRIPYPSDSDSGVLLDNLRDFEPQITANHDSTMLITGVDLAGNTVGKAFVGTMCTVQSSVGLSQDGRSSVDSVGSTAAHELGHIFNMDHDGNGCTCDDPTGTCIMSAVSGSPAPTVWSTCSRDDIVNWLAQDNLNTCLDNEPLVTVGDPVCGNGIRERDEICDCGTPEECIDPCCNATSCTLQAGAQCPNGDCCTDQCQFKPLGTVCRTATQECDIAEFCIGDSSSCPTDVYLQDGSLCDSDSNFCYDGVCETLDSQCQGFFGSASGIPQCFTEQNVAGEGGGNCGYSRGSFTACEPEHAPCGQLQCAEGEFMRGDVSGSLTIFTRFVRNDAGNFEQCMSFTTSPDSDTMNPGLVADGTKCGNTSLCEFQRCTQIASLSRIQSCPVGSNELVCSGTGVCNNLNQCSCGFEQSGLTCEMAVGPRGGGGGGGNAGIIAGAVVGVVLGIVLAVGVAVGVVLIVRKLYTSKEDRNYLPPARSAPEKAYVPPPLTRKTFPPPYDPQPSPPLKPSPRPPPNRNAPLRSLNAPSNHHAPPTRPGPSTPRNRPPPPPAPSPRAAPPPFSKPNPPAPIVARVPPHKPNPPTPPAKTAAPNKPPPAARPGKIQQQWPPAGNEVGAEKPAPPKKPVFPPRR